jgi:ABC-2 type transport system permease protein
VRSARIFAGYVAQFLKVRLAYRGDFLAEVLAGAFGTAAALLFVLLLFRKTTQLAGWTREEVLFVFGFSLVPFGLYSLLSSNLYDFADRYVIEGRFDRILLRPVNSFFQVLFESVRIPPIGDVLVGLATLLWAGSRLEVRLGFLDLAWLAIAALSGAVILVCVFGILASLSFRFEDRIGILPPFFNMTQFGRYPLPVFNRPLRFLLRFVLPFAFLAFYPSAHFLRRREFLLGCYATPLVALVLAAALGLVWTWGVRRYESTGS